MKARIASFTKTETGAYMMEIIAPTKKDGNVLYTYRLQGYLRLFKINAKPVFTYKDWNWIKSKGELISRKVLV